MPQPGTQSCRRQGRSGSAAGLTPRCNRVAPHVAQAAVTRAVCILRGWSITCLPHVQPSTEPAFCPLPKPPREALAGQAGQRGAPSLAKLAPLSPPLCAVHVATQANGSATGSQSHRAPWGIRGGVSLQGRATTAAWLPQPCGMPGPGDECFRLGRATDRGTVCQG